MSKPNPYPRPARPRPPLSTVGSENSDGTSSPPVPAPRRSGGGRPGSSLPTWPPPAKTASPPSPIPSKIDQRPPAPLPPPPSSPVPSLPSRDFGTPYRQPDIPPPIAAPPTPPVHSPSPALPNKNQVAFGSCLQQAHDAINKRHEDELHALESFRAHVFFRAKADREYAQELSKINARASKTLAAVSHSSPIIQVLHSIQTLCKPAPSTWFPRLQQVDTLD